MIHWRWTSARCPHQDGSGIIAPQVADGAATASGGNQLSAHQGDATAPQRRYVKEHGSLNKIIFVLIKLKQI